MGLAMHAAEDVLAAIQAGRLGATSLVIDHALACLDQVATWVDEFEAHEALPAGSGQAARDLAEDLRGLIQIQASTQPAAGRTAGRDSDEVPDWVAASRRAGHAEARAGIPVHRILLRAGSGLLLRRPRSAGSGPACARAPLFRVEAREAQPPLADLDPYSCNLRLRGICATTPAELAAVFRLMPDQIRIFEIPNHVHGRCWRRRRRRRDHADTRCVGRAGAGSADVRRSRARRGPHRLGNACHGWSAALQPAR